MITRLRRYIAKHLHFAADRLAPEDAFRGTGMSLYFDDRLKRHALDPDGKWGAQLWYQGDTEYAKIYPRERPLTIVDDIPPSAPFSAQRWGEDDLYKRIIGSKYEKP